MIRMFKGLIYITTQIQILRGVGINRVPTENSPESALLTTAATGNLTLLHAHIF